MAARAGIGATAFDTSVVIAALVDWHEAHRECLAAVTAALAEVRPLLPVPALVESYAVLTRLPTPHRLSPADAIEILDPLQRRVKLVPVPAGRTWKLLRKAADRGIAGGASYDAQIAAAAAWAGARRLLTLNVGHFERVAGDKLQIVRPA